MAGNPPGVGQINLALATSQWDACQDIAVQREADKSYPTLNALTEEQKVAYLTENGLVAPVIQDLREKISLRQADCQRYSEQVNKITDVLETTLRQSQTHHDVVETLGQAESTNTTDICQRALARVSQLTDSTVPQTSPLKFEPPKGSNIEAVFQQVLGNGKEDYGSAEINQVMFHMILQLNASENQHATAAGKTTVLEEQKKQLETQKLRVEEALIQAEREKADLKGKVKALEDGKANFLEKLKQADFEIAALPNLRTQVKELQARVNDAESSKKASDEKYIQLESASNEDSKNLAKAKTDLEKAQGRCADLERDVSTKDDQLQEATDDFNKLSEEKSTLEEQFESLLNERISTLSTENDDLNQTVAKLRREAINSEKAFQTAVTAILSAMITREDVDADVLRPLLPHNFSSIRDFRFEVVQPFKLADQYTGIDPTSSAQPDLTMVDLLRWARGCPVPSADEISPLSRMLSLESTLLEDVRTLQKRGAWVLLAFGVVLSMAKSESWLARCHAYVRLAVLGSQYVMIDQEQWLQTVLQLVQGHPDLQVDVLGQACLAHLAVTTQSPADLFSLISPNLVLDKVDRSTPIADIARLLCAPSNDLTAAANIGHMDVVIIRLNSEEVIFSKPNDGRSWTLSLDGLTFTKLSDTDQLFEMRWGSADRVDLSYTFKYQNNPLHDYIQRYYGSTAIAAAESVYFESVAERTRAALQARKPIQLSDSDSS